jgi:uncharacterized protein DUF6790
MYLAVVFLTMFALPVGSILVEHSLLHSAAPVMALVGKWFVFWATGVRLALAGLRQYFEPRFTAEEIFGVRNDGALPFVRELGIANFAIGTVGVLSLLRPDFVAPVALAATIFYGAVGFRHAAQPGRNAKETIAMASDLFAFLVLGAYSVFALSSISA